MEKVAALEELRSILSPSLYVGAVLLIALEAAVFSCVRVPRDKRSRWLGIKSGALSFGLGGLVSGTVTLAAQAWFFEHRVFDLGLGPLAFVVALLMLDLMFYVQHRASHEMRLLWALHVVHHSSRHYDLTAGVRGSVFDPLLTFWFHAWIPLLGIHPLIVVIVDTAFKFYGLAYHTEAVGRLGILDDVLVTPSNHRAHHGKDVEYLDCNYGGLFVWWDKLCGTYRREGQTPSYGISKPWHGHGLVDCQLHEVVDLWRDVKAAPTWRDKLLTLVMPPGWRWDGTGQTARDLKRAAGLLPDRPR
jgi:sterol desaturase/sphingolipid hydroxylase (fatty acid hydroxylase superfamily)